MYSRDAESPTQALLGGGGHTDAGKSDYFRRASGASVYGRFDDAVLRTYRGQVMQAAQRRDVHRIESIVSNMIESKALGASQLDDCFALHHVAWAGLNDLADRLVELGCTPFHTDMNGDTVFHYCARGCNLRLLKKFHKQHGNPIFHQLNNNHLNLFLTVCAEAPDEKAYEVLGLLEWIYLCGMSLELPDCVGRTPLMWACQRGSIMLVQWLLARGANLHHRDYHGRTVLHLAVMSGEEEVLRLICSRGGINFLEAESNDEVTSNTALKLCWQRGHYFLGLSLRQWAFQKRIFGFMKVFDDVYAWYYWCLMVFNLALFLAVTVRLVSMDMKMLFHTSVFAILWVLTEIFWLSAFFADPGYVKKNVMPDQSYRCSLVYRADLNQPHVVACRAGSATHKLQLLEKEMQKAGADLCYLNKKFGLRTPSINNIPPEAYGPYEDVALRMQDTRNLISKLMERIGAERRADCPKGYVRQVVEGNSRKICLTCRIMKPFRAHHCSDCGACVDRFDHHCIWVDNCIGKGNQRSFLCFLFFLTLTIPYLWYIVGLFYYKIIIKKETEVSLLEEPIFYVSVANSLANVLWGGFVSFLFFRTLKSVVSNITFYEFLKRPSHIQRRFGHNTAGCCWDLSDLTPVTFFRNIYAFFSLDDSFDREDYPDAAIDGKQTRPYYQAVAAPLEEVMYANKGQTNETEGTLYQLPGKTEYIELKPQRKYGSAEKGLALKDQQQPGSYGYTNFSYTSMARRGLSAVSTTGTTPAAAIP